MAITANENADHTKDFRSTLRILMIRLSPWALSLSHAQDQGSNIFLFYRVGIKNKTVICFKSKANMMRKNI